MPVVVAVLVIARVTKHDSHTITTLPAAPSTPGPRDVPGVPVAGVNMYRARNLAPAIAALRSRWAPARSC